MAGKTPWSELEAVTSVPFARRADAYRLQQQRQAQGSGRGLFRVLLGVIAVGVTSTILVTWYMQRELPMAQKRAKESEALLAPPSLSFCSRARPPMVCAHGGDTTHAPPNTVSAFRASLAAGADCVEVDAALSRDGLLVVMHVRELAQLLGRSGVQVGDMTGAELLALRWPSGEAVMSVEEAVRLTSPFVDCVTLDVKTYNDQSGVPQDEEAIAGALVRLVAATGCGNCLIWAKSDRVVRRVLEMSPGQRTGYIVMNETAESRRLGMQHPLRFGGTRTVDAAAVAAAAERRRSLQQQQHQQQLSEPSGAGNGAAGTSRRPLSPAELLEQQQQEQQQQQQWLGQRQPRQLLPEGGDQEQEQREKEQGEMMKQARRGERGRGQAAGAAAVAGAAAGESRAPPPTQQPAVVGVHFAMVEPALLQQLHGAGKQLFAWTINQAEVLKQVLDVGVDALVTNYPLTALEAIDSRLSKCGPLMASRGGGGIRRGAPGGGGTGAGGGDGLANRDYL